MRDTASTSFNLHPTQDLKVRVSALYTVSPRPSDTFCVDLNEHGLQITIFFSDGEALTKFSEDLQQQVLDARMAQEGVQT
jgi:hypothetical protein